jgi:hypothetical protein
MLNWVVSGGDAYWVQTTSGVLFLLGRRNLSSTHTAVNKAAVRITSPDRGSGGEGIEVKFS